MTKTFCIAAVAVFVAVVPAQAAPLDLVSGNIISSDTALPGYPSDNSVTSTSPLSISGFAGNGAYETAQAGLPAINGLSIPFAEATSSATSFGSLNTMRAVDEYQFAVVGPTNTVVPVSFSGNLAANFSGGGGNEYAAATVQVYSLPLSSTLFQDSAGAAPAVASSSHEYGTLLDVTANTPYTIALRATVSSGKGSGTALSDPVLAIDALFLAENPGYSLEFSPGIDNKSVSAVPLPAALPLFGSGVIALAGFAWRREKVSA